MKETLLKIINKAALALLLILAFLQPLLFLDIFTDIFELPKTLLLYSSIALLLILLALRWLLTGVRVNYDRYLFVMVVLALSAFASAYFGSSRISSWLYGLPPFVALTATYFLALQFFATDGTKKVSWRPLLSALLASGFVLSLWRLLSFAQIYLPLTGNLGEMLKLRAFTPVGSGLSLVLYLSLLLPIALGFLLGSGNGRTAAPLLDPTTKPQNPKAPFSSVLRPLFSVLYLLTAGLTLVLTGPTWSLFVILPLLLLLLRTSPSVLRQKGPLLLAVVFVLVVVLALFRIPLSFNNSLLDSAKNFPQDIQADLRISWIVAVNTIRDYPLFGTGLGTFSLDFARFRPLDYNLSPIWYLRLGQSNNYLFQLLCTLGLAGTALYLWLASKIIGKGRNALSTDRPTQVALFASLIAFLLSNLLAVPSLTVLTAFVLLLAAFSLEQGEVKEWSATSVTPQPQRHTLPLLLLAPLCLLSVAIFYLTLRLGYGEFTFRQSFNLLNEQKAVEGFNLLQRALNVNPYRDNYHLSAASLAFSLADQAASRILGAGYSLIPDPKEAAPSTSISNDRALMNQLLDYAIKEAKNAVTLDPFNADNWQGLASLYRNISGFVQNAADWSVATYQQAAMVDPTNPLLRLDLGGLFYLAGDFESATNHFRDAAILKSDLPNAHYNLAWAYRQKGLIVAAVNEMTVVTRLLPLDSADYKKANEELEQFKALLPRPTPTPTPAAQESELNLTAPSNELAQPRPQKVILPEASPSAL